MTLRGRGQQVAWGSAWLLGIGTVGALLTDRVSGNVDGQVTAYWFLAWGLVGLAAGIALRLSTRH
jgi:hypothetical protein